MPRSTHPSRAHLPVDSDVEADAADRELARSTGVIRETRSILAARWDVLLVIAAGGALGSLARWGLGELVGGDADRFPWATFVANVTGSFALGVLMVLAVELFSTSRYLRPFLGVGLLGGFTTFSTYQLDTRALVAADRVPLAAVYVGGTVVSVLLAVWLGLALARSVVAAAGRRRPASSSSS